MLPSLTGVARCFLTRCHSILAQETIVTHDENHCYLVWRLTIADSWRACFSDLIYTAAKQSTVMITVTVVNVYCVSYSLYVSVRYTVNSGSGRIVKIGTTDQFRTFTRNS